MSDFKWLDDRAIRRGKPADAFTLNRMLDNTNHVFETRGNHVSYLWDARTSDTISKRIRPFCSVTRWLTLLRVPYWVSPGLDRIKVILLCRVSNSNLDADEKMSYADYGVLLRLGLDSDPSEIPSVVVRPLIGAALKPEWRIVEIEYQVGPDILSQFGGRGGMTYLNLFFKSQTPAYWGETFGKSPVVEAPYILAYQQMDSISGGDYFKVTADGFFAEGAVATAPAPGANETVCLGIFQKKAEDKYELTGIYDPVRAWPGVNGRAMRVDGPPIQYESGTYGAKIVASYIQPISMQLFETYK